MAWYPKAVRKQLTYPNRARNKVRMARPVRINFHTAVSNSNSLYGFFNTAAAKGVFSHFYVRRDGTVEQYQDTAYTAACDLDGNPDTISIETWDGYRLGYPGYWNYDSDVPPWRPEQVEALVELSRWIIRTHPTIPAKLATSNARGTASHGFSWHRLGVVGAPGFISRIDGGLTYSLARGKVCPGIRRINQVPAIFKAATTAVSATPSPGLPSTGVSDPAPTTIEEFIMSLTPAERDAFAKQIALETWRVQTHYSGESVSQINEHIYQRRALDSILAKLAAQEAAYKAAAAGGVDMDAVEAAAERGAAAALRDVTLKAV